MSKIKELVKILYQFKIKTFFYFALGWAELSTPIAVVRDIAIILTFAKLVFGISFSYLLDGLICLGCFLGFIGIGWALKATGMSAYGNKLNNSVNEEVMLIRKIAERLNVQ